MAGLFDASAAILNAVLTILSHLWVYLILWLFQFVVVKLYLNQSNRKFSDIGGVLVKFRILFILALLIGFYLGLRVG